MARMDLDATAKTKKPKWKKREKCSKKDRPPRKKRNSENGMKADHRLRATAHTGRWTDGTGVLQAAKTVLKVASCTEERFQLNKCFCKRNNCRHGKENQRHSIHGA